MLQNHAKMVMLQDIKLNLSPAIIFICGALLIGSCSVKPSGSNNNETPAYDLVNTFIGTGGHGHTYPGATLPFGLMQLSPDTRLDGWDGCSGYHYSDSIIYGFSHTHLSGTGVSDYGDLLIMPTNKKILNNGADGEPGYRSKFSHSSEKASPGYYAVKLEDTNIDVELTTSYRSGIHKYQFPNSENQFITIDFSHRDKTINAKIKQVAQNELNGFRFSDAWAKDQRFYFHIKSSHNLKLRTLSASKNGDRISYSFTNPNNTPVLLYVGISGVDEAGAKNNLEEEIGGKSFEQVKNDAREIWTRQLNKIHVSSEDRDKQVIFYSALYHTMLAPNIFNDVDGRYRGMDLKIHEAIGHDYYTVFSLWDTYRAAHPLYTIIEQDRTNDFIKTFIAKHDEGGIMPIWDLWGNYTGCMIGYHAVPVIADAYLKGIRDYNVERAYGAMKHSAMQDKLGLKYYKEYGFIPLEFESESVSKTLEYAYDDWTIAQMAKDLNKKKDYIQFLKRAQYYKNVYDPDTKFMRARIRNQWFAPFDPYEVNFNYTEANSWQYSFYAPQDISGLSKLMGGDNVLEKQLDELFTAENNTSGRHQVDITGLIGQYAHGNEPSHHMAYLYNYLGQPHKTQQRVHEILTTLYSNAPDGISGNEDCGQMSAWYNFSAMGFYPVTPGSNDYIIGTPLFDEVKINLENGNTFIIKRYNGSDRNKYIEDAKLNGQPLTRSFLKHEDIMRGGTLEFNMNSSPTNWATEKANRPISEINEHLITPVPFIDKGKISSREVQKIELKSADPDAEIYFSTHPRDLAIYNAPFQLGGQDTLTIFARNGNTTSSSFSTSFYTIPKNRSIKLHTKYANQYNAGGDEALIDGLRGTTDFRTGAWQGYWDTDLDAQINFKTAEGYNNIQLTFLLDQRSWIFYPTEVTCTLQLQNGEEETLPPIKINAAEPIENVELKSVNFYVRGKKIKSARISAKNFGTLPEWHLGHPHKGKAWIFVDEIIFK